MPLRTPRVRRGRTRLGVLAVAAALAPAGLAAHELPGVGEPTPAAGLTSMLEQLDAPDHAARESATAALTESDVQDEELFQVLDAGGLTLEQTRRVQRALFARFRSRPPAAIGIQYSGSPPLLSRVYEGFPAGRRGLLKAGDRLQAIDGVRLDDSAGAADPTRAVSNRMRTAVICRSHGDTVPMLVERDGELLNIDVPLGSWSDFPARSVGSEIADREWASAWKRRLRLMGLSGGPDPARLEASGISLQELIEACRAEVASSCRITGPLPAEVLRERPAAQLNGGRRLAAPLNDADAFRNRQLRFIGGSVARASRTPRPDRFQAIRDTTIVERTDREATADSRLSGESLRLAAEMGDLTSSLAEALRRSSSSGADAEVRRDARRDADRIRARLDEIKSVLADLTARGG